MLASRGNRTSYTGRIERVIYEIELLRTRMRSESQAEVEFEVSCKDTDTVSLYFGSGTAPYRLLICIVADPGRGLGDTRQDAGSDGCHLRLHGGVARPLAE
jgi:hypothetical protein